MYNRMSKLKKYVLLVIALLILGFSQTDNDMIRKYQNEISQCDSSLQLIALTTKQYSVNFETINTLFLVMKFHYIAQICKTELIDLGSFILFFESMINDKDKEFIAVWTCLKMTTMAMDFDGYANEIAEILSNEKNEGLVLAGGKLKNKLAEVAGWLRDAYGNYEKYLDME